MKNYVWPCFALLLALALFTPIHDGDVFFYLSLGRFLAQGNWIPVQDPFLYTFKDWNIYHQWLSFPIFYLFYAVAGLAGIFALRITLWISLFGIIAVAARRWKIQEGIVFLFFIPALIASSHRFIDRGSVMSDFILIYLTVIFLNDEAISKRKLCALPLLFVCWVNLHAAFVIGLALFTAYAVAKGRRASKELWISVAASYAATLINPQFVKGAFFPIHTAFKPEWASYRAINFEWMPTFQAPFIQAPEAQFLLAILVIATLLTAWIFRKQNIFPLFAFLVYAYLAQSAARFLSTAALGLTLVSLYALHEKNFRIPEKANTWLKLSLSAAFLIAGAYILRNGYPSSAGPQRIAFGIDEKSFPVKAVDFIEEHQLEGRIFNQYEWGSYLVWRLDRRDNLFIHTHIDDPKFLTDGYYGTGSSPAQFLETVRRDDIKYFLLDTAVVKMNPRPMIVNYLADWRVVYQDNTATLWERPSL